MEGQEYTQTQFDRANRGYIRKEKMKAMFHRVGSKIKKVGKGKNLEGCYIDDPNVIEYSLSKYQKNVTKDKRLQKKLRKKQAHTQGRDDDELIYPPELVDDTRSIGAIQGDEYNEPSTEITDSILNSISCIWSLPQTSDIYIDQSYNGNKNMAVVEDVREVTVEGDGIRENTDDNDNRREIQEKGDSILNTIDASWVFQLAQASDGKIDQNDYGNENQINVEEDIRKVGKEEDNTKEVEARVEENNIGEAKENGGSILNSIGWVFPLSQASDGKIEPNDYGNENKINVEDNREVVVEEDNAKEVETKVESDNIGDTIAESGSILNSLGCVFPLSQASDRKIDPNDYGNEKEINAEDIRAVVAEEENTKEAEARVKDDNIGEARAEGGSFLSSIGCIFPLSHTSDEKIDPNDSGNEDKINVEEDARVVEVEEGDTKEVEARVEDDNIGESRAEGGSILNPIGWAFTLSQTGDKNVDRHDDGDPNKYNNTEKDIRDDEAERDDTREVENKVDDAIDAGAEGGSILNPIGWVFPPPQTSDEDVYGRENEESSQNEIEIMDENKNNNKEDVREMGSERNDTGEAGAEGGSILDSIGWVLPLAETSDEGKCENENPIKDETENKIESKQKEDTSEIRVECDDTRNFAGRDNTKEVRANEDVTGDVGVEVEGIKAEGYDGNQADKKRKKKEGTNEIGGKVEKRRWRRSTTKGSLKTAKVKAAQEKVTESIETEQLPTNKKSKQPAAKRLFKPPRPSIIRLVKSASRSPSEKVSPPPSSFKKSFNIVRTSSKVLVNSARKASKSTGKIVQRTSQTSKDLATNIKRMVGSNQKKEASALLVSVSDMLQHSDGYKTPGSLLKSIQTLIHDTEHSMPGSRNITLRECRRSYRKSKSMKKTITNVKTIEMEPLTHDGNEPKKGNNSENEEKHAQSEVKPLTPDKNESKNGQANKHEQKKVRSEVNQPNSEVREESIRSIIDSETEINNVIDVYYSDDEDYRDVDIDSETELDDDTRYSESSAYISDFINEDASLYSIEDDIETYTDFDYDGLTSERAEEETLNSNDGYTTGYTFVATKSLNADYADSDEDYVDDIDYDDYDDDDTYASCLLSERDQATLNRIEKELQELEGMHENERQGWLLQALIPED